MPFYEMEITVSSSQFRNVIPDHTATIQGHASDPTCMTIFPVFCATYKATSYEKGAEPPEISVC